MTETEKLLRDIEALRSQARLAESELERDGTDVEFTAVRAALEGLKDTIRNHLEVLWTLDDE